MNKYEELRDGLICDRNDEIDNASYALLCSVAGEVSAEKQNDDLKVLVGVLMPKDYQPEKRANLFAIMQRVKDTVADYEIKKNGDGEIEWNMEFIAGVTEVVEAELDKAKIGTCHPFFMEDDEIDEDDPLYDEDNDGILCCLSYDRCSWCKECDKKPED